MRWSDGTKYGTVCDVDYPVCGKPARFAVLTDEDPEVGACCGEHGHSGSTDHIPIHEAPAYLLVERDVHLQRTEGGA